MATEQIKERRRSTDQPQNSDTSTADKALGAGIGGAAIGGAIAGPIGAAVGATVGIGLVLTTTHHERGTKAPS
jgi:hypothetical protein